MPKFQARIRVVDTGQRFTVKDGELEYEKRNISFWIEKAPKERDRGHYVQVLSWDGTGTEDPIIFTLRRAIEQAYTRGFLDGCMDWPEEDLKDDISHRQEEANPVS